MFYNSAFKFTFVFLPCNCVRLLIMARSKLYRGIFLLTKKNLSFNWGFFVEKLLNFPVFQGSSTSSSFRIRRCSDADPKWFFSGSGFCEHFRIRPDPQRWLRALKFNFMFVCRLRSKEPKTWRGPRTSTRRSTTFWVSSSFVCQEQCCGYISFWCGSGSSDPCLWLMDPD